MPISGAGAITVEQRDGRVKHGEVVRGQAAAIKR